MHISSDPWISGDRSDTFYNLLLCTKDGMFKNHNSFGSCIFYGVIIFLIYVMAESACFTCFLHRFVLTKQQTYYRNHRMA